MTRKIPRSFAAIGLVAVSAVALVLASVLLLGRLPAEQKAAGPPEHVGREVFDRPYVYTTTTRYNGTSGDGHFTTTVYYSDTTHYAIDLPDLPDGSEWKPDGAEWQDGNLYVQSWPGGFDYERRESVGDVMLGSGEPDLASGFCFPADWPKALDLGAVAALATAGRISDTLAADRFGRPVRLAEWDKTVHDDMDCRADQVQVWYDAETGFRYQVEENGGPDGWGRVVVAGIRFNQAIDASRLKFPGDLREARYAQEAWPFDLAAKRPYPPESREAIVPRRTEFAHGFVAGTPGFYTRTAQSNGVGGYWLIGQRLAGPGGREILVAQGLKEIHYFAPYYEVAGPYWPFGRGAWEEPNWGLDSVPAKLDDGTEVLLYNLDNSSHPGRYLASLDISPTLKILFVGNSKLTSGQEILDVMSQYRAR